MCYRSFAVVRLSHTQDPGEKRMQDWKEIYLYTVLYIYNILAFGPFSDFTTHELKERCRRRRSNHFIIPLGQHHSTKALNIGGPETPAAAQEHKGQDGTYAPGCWSPGSKSHREVRAHTQATLALICFNFAVPAKPVEVCYTVEKNESGGSFLLRLRWQVRNRLCKEHTVVEEKHFQKSSQPIFHRTVTSAALEVVSLHIR